MGCKPGFELGSLGRSPLPDGRPPLKFAEGDEADAGLGADERPKHGRLEPTFDAERGDVGVKDEALQRVQARFERRIA